jgi:RNA polymerase sigma factor (sigma-70 family)
MQHQGLLLGSEECYQKFIVDNIPLTITIAAGYARLFPGELEDLKSVAQLALVESADKLMCREHDNPIGYIILNIRAKCLKYLKALPTVHAPVGTNNIVHFPVREPLEDIPSDEFIEFELLEDIRIKLPEKYHKVMDLRLEGLDDTDIARRLGVTRSRISQIRTEMRKAYADKG